MKKQKSEAKLTLARETLRQLDSRLLQEALGGAEHPEISGSLAYCKR